MDPQPTSELDQPQDEATDAVAPVETADQAASPADDQPEPDVAPTTSAAPEQALSWQATEYIHHHKGAAWYVGVVVVIAVLLAVAVIFKLWLSIGVFTVMGLALIVYAHKPPRVLNYELDEDGVAIDTKHYPYKQFRSFGVISDVEWHAIDLEPTQRFMPRLTVLFGDNDFDAIVGHLQLHLPRVDRQPDLIERLSRYLRF